MKFGMGMGVCMGLYYLSLQLQAKFGPILDAKGDRYLSVNSPELFFVGLWTFRSRNETAYSLSNFRALERLSEPNEEKE